MSFNLFSNPAETSVMSLVNVHNNTINRESINSEVNMIMDYS